MSGYTNFVQQNKKTFFPHPMNTQLVCSMKKREVKFDVTMSVYDVHARDELQYARTYPQARVRMVL